MEEGGGRVRQAYGEAKYRRLAALKRAYDPANLFRLNQNVPGLSGTPLSAAPGSAGA